MKKEEIVDIIISALQKKEVLAGFHKIQNNKTVQIKLTAGTYFNFGMSELKKNKSFIVQKLR